MAAEHVLDRLTRQTGWERSLPIPIDQIVEDVYQLRIDWVLLDEPPGVTILGALEPATRTIFMNELHAETIFDWVGPIEFTLAHELGHWINDVTPETIRAECQIAAVSSRAAGRREAVANRFAARLLLPADLLQDAVDAQGDTNIANLAQACGVSMAMLRVRLQEVALK